jgi:hypothetical protein
MNGKIGVQVITFLTVFLFVSSALSPTVQSIPPITQETLIVDITGNGDYTSIREALANADVTDIILIRKGIYNEYNLVVSKKIEITGEEPSNTIIDCSGNIAFTLNSPYVDISNLQIINTGESAIIISPGSTGCTVSNCIINTNYKAVAVSIRSSYNTISDCTIIGLDTSKQGVKIQGSYNVVENCDIQDFANGILTIYGTNNQILNCNILNNEVAIDFRLSSNNNLVTGCNIYFNLHSIRIWQNSNNNLIYLNNFWKNDITAIVEENNSWDNGAEGNYWDRYRGQDSNGDGIGDTPYKISEGNEDRFPRVSMILPDIITHPTYVKHTTSKSDTTPSFSWYPSVYSKGIKGYYVKIDTNSEVFIGDTTSWTSSITLSDGVHMFYVRAEGLDGTLSNYSIISFTIDTTIIDSDGDGWSDQEEEQYGTDANNSNHYPLDTDDDHIPDSVDTDDDDDGYSDEMELSYGTDEANPIFYPTDTDHDGVPNDDSKDGKYIGDLDDDDDGLTDTTEALIGSSSVNGSDVTRIYIGGNSYYLVDVSHNGIFDILYEPIDDISTGVEKYGADYRIDVDGDGSYDHIYNTLDGSVSAYSEPIIIPIAIWLLIILVVLLAALYFVPRYLKERFIKYKVRRKPKKLIRRPIIEKTLKIPISEKKDTVMMIDQTKTLLQNIHQDVEEYMEKLKELEQQFTTMPIVEEKKVVEPTVIKPPLEEPPEEKPLSEETKDVQEIEAKVDQLLSAKDDKNKNK